MANSIAEIGRQWDRDIVPVLQSESIGRSLIPKNMKLSGKGIGNTSVKTFGYKGTAAAITDYNIRGDIADTLDVGDSQILIPIQQDMITIPRRSYEAMAEGGYAVDSDMALDMAKKVSLELDTTFIQGWKPDGTNYEVKGLYQVAGNSHAGYDLGTYGNLIKTVAKGLQLLQEDKIYAPAYNLVIAADQYFETVVSESTAGIEEYTKALKLLNLRAGGSQPGQILMSTDLASGTGFMCPIATQATMQYFDYVEAQQPKFSSFFSNGDTESGDINMRLMGAAVPRFKHLDSSSLTDPCVCKFTTL